MNFAAANSNCTFAVYNGKSFSSCAFSLIIALVGAAVAVSAFLFASVISVEGIIILALISLLIIVRVIILASGNRKFLKQTDK